MRAAGGMMAHPPPGRGDGRAKSTGREVVTMAARVVIDGEGRECAVVVDWCDWRRLADVARGALPFLFDCVGDDDATGDGDHAGVGGGNARPTGNA